MRLTEWPGAHNFHSRHNMPDYRQQYRAMLLQNYYRWASYDCNRLLPRPYMLGNTTWLIHMLSAHDQNNHNLPGVYWCNRRLLVPNASWRKSLYCHGLLQWSCV